MTSRNKRKERVRKQNYKNRVVNIPPNNILNAMKLIKLVIKSLSRVDHKHVGSHWLKWWSKRSKASKPGPKRLSVIGFTLADVKQNHMKRLEM